MNADRSVTVYRRFLRVYPRAVREEYGDDMAQLFADQLRDESGPRVWGRCVVDLLITVPARHLEAHMHRPSNALVPSSFAAISLTAVVAGAVYGSNLGWLGFALAVAVAAGSLAIAAHRGQRRVTTSHPLSAQWWKLVLAGGSVLAGFIALTSAVGALADPWWLPMMLALLLGAGTLVTGLLLGVAHLTSHHGHRTST